MCSYGRTRKARRSLLSTSRGSTCGDGSSLRQRKSALEAADREMTRERGEELRIPQPEGGVPPSHDPRPSDAEAKVGLVLSLPERDVAFLEWLGLNHVSDAVHTLVSWYQRLPPAHRGELLELLDPHDATQAAQGMVGDPTLPQSQES
jgi:hypothetical protein